MSDRKHLWYEHINILLHEASSKAVSDHLWFSISNIRPFYMKNGFNWFVKFNWKRHNILFSYFDLIFLVFILLVFVLTNQVRAKVVLFKYMHFLSVCYYWKCKMCLVMNWGRGFSWTASFECWPVHLGMKSNFSTLLKISI